jgi:hypothetical protein
MFRQVSPNRYDFSKIGGQRVYLIFGRF